MKKLLTVTISCLMALMIAILSPLTVFAKASENASGSDKPAGKGRYISEVRIGMGKDADQAAAALKGYTILSDSSGRVDLNKDAGGGWGSKGDKVVYLGYKTTDDANDAVTDLAVMNMKGGYSTEDYDALFEDYIEGQIVPLLDRLIAAVAEYRVNFSSQNESNRQRAEYVRRALNMFIDDDTGKGMGDLLLNRTKYEMGDEAYKALSELQKKNTADILTILAQANGKSTLMIENLIARAADTSDDTWIDRFSTTTYDDLVEEICDAEGILPSEAGKRLAVLYEDDARKIRAMWNDFCNMLSGYDEAVELIENFDMDAARTRAKELKEYIDSFDETTGSAEDLKEAVKEQFELLADIAEALNAAKAIGVYEFLQNVEYGDGTLVDFFGRRASEVNITELYPIAASFSKGQKAGLDFVSLCELVVIALTDSSVYDEAELEGMTEISIYDGVDRGIYEKGGIGLTSEKRRSDVIEQVVGDPGLSSTTCMVIAMAGVSAGFLVSSSTAWILSNRELNKMIDAYDSAEQTMYSVAQGKPGFSHEDLMAFDADYKSAFNRTKHIQDELYPAAQSNYNMCKYLTIGLGVAMVILIGLSIYLSYMDMVEYYRVEFTPIPRYMVDEKDITAYNAKGEKIFIKNQTAYYKAVRCNRTADDEMYKTLGTCADLNGDVGRQWLALYAAKQNGMAPILADSLKAVTGKADIPANYTTGIHLFGSGSAFNLNNPLYVWEGEAPSVFVYFNVDDKANRSAAGSLFAGGEIAISGGIGLIVGALAACAVMSAIRKKKNRKENAAA